MYIHKIHTSIYLHIYIYTHIQIVILVISTLIQQTSPRLAGTRGLFVHLCQVTDPEIQDAHDLRRLDDKILTMENRDENIGKPWENHSKTTGKQ